MKQLAPGVAVIGHYEPQFMISEQIAKHLIKIVEQNNLINMFIGGWIGASWTSDRISAEVRSPKAIPIINKNVAAEWHTDVPGNGGVAMVMWSNREQTELMLPDGTTVQAEPGDILIVNNDAVKHRSPQKMSEDRWFFRQFVVCPSWLKIV